MTNRNKAKGTAFEVALVNATQDAGLWASRVPAFGFQDRGDINIGPDVVTLEAKNTPSDILGGIRDAVSEVGPEADRAGTPWGFGVVKRPGKGPLDAYVVMTYRDALRLFKALIEHDEIYPGPPGDVER